MNTQKEKTKIESPFFNRKPRKDFHHCENFDDGLTRVAPEGEFKAIRTQPSFSNLLGKKDLDLLWNK